MKNVLLVPVLLSLVLGACEQRIAKKPSPAQQSLRTSADAATAELGRRSDGQIQPVQPQPATSAASRASGDDSPRKCSILVEEAKRRPRPGQVVKLDKFCAFVCKTDKDCAKGKCTRKGLKGPGLSSDIAEGSKKIEHVKFCSLDATPLD